MLPEQIQLRTRILIAVHKALLGSIPSKIRAIGLNWNETSIIFLFAFEQEPSNEEQEEMKAVGQRIGPDFPESQVTAKFIVIPYPQYINRLGQDLIFARKHIDPTHPK